MKNLHKIETRKNYIIDTSVFFKDIAAFDEALKKMEDALKELKLKPDAFYLSPNYFKSLRSK